ncbi:spore germination protein [Pelotomaculum terephthalicicum JT]|uniref:spore germination protein n=1 Tax=Pelotomaculum TaxID=191373 RepID=UPI0009D19D60|nr:MULTISPECIES: spore germination protein [Pelotomaculum]MCG9969457.1 spore germination protein [Pelotomaculum terephthalicicum JT]OPX89355.1 MAG: Spore germination protein B1 [Pelotomaculum sp. PtaB.Bin117]
MRFIKFIRRGMSGRRKSDSGQQDNGSKNQKKENLTANQEPRNQDLSSDLQTNLRQIRAILSECSDVIYREFDFAQDERIKLALVYLDGMVDKTRVSDQIMHSLMLDAPLVEQGEEFTRTRVFAIIKKRLLPIQQIEETNNLDQVIDAVLAGDAVLLVDGCACAVINDAKGWESRSIEESQTELVVRGPREAFVETLRVNTSLIRRKIKNPNLKIEAMKLGQITKTDIAIVYIKGIVNEQVVTEVKERLNRINIDSILETGYIEELVEDNPLSPFCTVLHTERPDKVAAQLLEGRVAILVDGTPYVLTVPLLFVEAIQSPEDYYERPMFSSVMRLLRWFSMIISLLAPSLYIAIITFHHEMLPTALLLSLAAQRETVPFPAFVETFMMEFVFEILREAGIRLPRQVGQAVSIVGALVIGQAAVQAGLVAAGTVILVALTGIASFTFCYYASTSIRLLRFPIMVLAGTLGLYGVICGVLAILVHLATLRSFGVPYLSPLAPLNTDGLKDVAVRMPWWTMLRRPRLVGMANPQRVARGLKPAPPPTRGKR